MAISTSQLETDLGNIISDMPATVTYAGSTFEGALTDVTKDRELEAGGYINEFDAQVYTKVSNFGSLPSAGVTMSISSTTYRVDKVTTSPDGIGVRFDLITPNK